MITFGASMTAGAAVSTFVCWWWPRFDAPAWKLWLAATFFNPLMLAAIGWSIAEHECLLSGAHGWNCMFSELGPIVAAICLPAPIIAIAVRWWASKRVS